MAADLAAPAQLGGRPTTYTPDLGATICERIMEGESLTTICAGEDLPSKGQVLRWLAQQPEFRVLYRQARLMACELLADELIGIADDALGDFVLNAAGLPVFDGQHVQRSRLRVDTRKWLLTKMLPRAYGARIEAPLLPGQPEPGEPTGAGGEPILLARQLTPQQRRAVSQALAAKFTIEQDMATNG